MTAPLAQASLSAAAYVLIVVSPFVFLRLLLGRRPFAGLPPGTVPRFLLLGAGSALLAVLVNWGLGFLGIVVRVGEAVEQGLPLWQALAVSFVLAGVVEEGAKLAVLRAGLGACPDHATLIVAGLLVGAGFGIVENAANVHAAAAATQAGPAALGVALVRSFVLLHPVATGLAADGLGRRAFGPPRWAGWLWRGFGLAVLVHGLWDLAVFWQPEGVWAAQNLLFPWLIWWGSRRSSDRILRLSGRGPARAARRRPPWAAATLVAFGLLHLQTLVQSLPVSLEPPPEPVTIYGLELDGEAGLVGLLVYNLLLSAAGLVGVIATARRHRWGVWIYAAGAAAGLLAELAVIGVAAKASVLRFSAAELSDDLVSFGSALLFLSPVGRRALFGCQASGEGALPAAAGAPGAGHRRSARTAAGAGAAVSALTPPVVSGPTHVSTGAARAPADDR